jgi:hypothetical protein
MIIERTRLGNVGNSKFVIARFEKKHKIRLMKTSLEPCAVHRLGNLKNAVRILMLVVSLLWIGGVQSRVDGQWILNNPAFTTFVPATAVSVEILTDRNNFSVREPISMKLRIVNVSNRPIYVPRTATVGCPTVTLHVDAGLEDSTGRRTGRGSGASCAGSYNPTVTQRMNREAVLLKPDEHFDLTTTVPIPMGVPPGAYRLEAILYGWNLTRFTEEEMMELAKFGNPFLRGEVPVSMRVTLTP